MKVLITGGHLTPAIAVIEELKKKKIEIVFVGRRYVQPGEKVDSFEYLEIKGQEVNFINLNTGRFNRSASVSIIINLFQFAFGIVSARKIVVSEKPDMILSFGGYIAMPVCIVAHLLGVPVFTHEQTMRPGVSNRLIGLFAKKVFISFPEAEKYFKAAKTVVIGNPIRQNIFHESQPKLSIPQDRPIIFVTGGALGAHSINEHIEKLLPNFLTQYTIIHQIGNVKKYGDFERLSEIQNNHYLVRQHFTSFEIGQIYKVADIVICRAGANTVFELIALRKPSILIPLPLSASGEQQAHARLIQEAGGAEIFDQNQDGRLLAEKIVKVLGSKERYSLNLKKLQHLVKPNAASDLVTQLLS